ncbi:DUF1365 domain-containing protein [Hydrogenophaga sp.]|uniref:DUF1365 domain-containing protein n=1 Tax=Hydrogenophaga sp. TaxID=1904254 RepID=UPI002719709F|nr:DUF1365 domain-containing protein [Hydrogenophaga sp.]MDO9604926.1 DUF1365 domain-containing protein [Hydrogenophaga sp.]
MADASAGATDPSAVPGRPKQARTPSGGSEAHAVASVGATDPSAVPSQAGSALIGFGQVRHVRHRPTRNAFVYPTYFLMLPMRSLRAHGPGALARNRRAALAFHDRDHGDGGPDSLAWLDRLLLQHGITDAQGEVWLHTYPRVLGYSFKPVSFWYCHRADGSLRAVLAEVNNTFGERHCYLLDAPRLGVPCTADKVFHVSPFCPVRGHYRFVFMRTRHAGTERTVARIDYFDADDAPVLINTSVSGVLEPLTTQTQRRALWAHPAMTLGVIARIHWQAVRLWLSHTPFFRQPAAPRDFVSAGDAPPPVRPR